MPGRACIEAFCLKQFVTSRRLGVIRIFDLQRDVPRPCAISSARYGQLLNVWPFRQTSWL